MWYIVNLYGLYKRQAFITKREAVNVILNDCNDKRKRVRLEKLGEGFYQYLYDLKLFFVIEEEWAMQNGYEWIRTELNKGGNNA
jgi:hypothetical protein